MNKSLRFKLLTKFTSLIQSLTAYMNRRGIPARKGFLAVVSVGLFFLFTLNPFSSRAQFPYEETFRNSTTNKPDVKFGGGPTAFLTALKPISGSVTDAQGEGYLRLTNNTKKQKGYVYSNNIFLGTYGLNIEFEYFTYGGGNDGADGLCFFLFDAAVADADFNIGGFGGSLGYAQLYKDNTNFSGVSKGYLGIGLDEFGNFSNHNENRQGDKDQIPNSVTIRGAGNGPANNPSNYPLLTTVKTSTLETDAFNIAGGLRTATDGNPEYRKVLINLVPRSGGGLLISVSIKHGSVITPVIVKYPYTTPIPAKGLKYGIASSTGDNVNYHEIRGLMLTVDKSVLSTPVAPSPSMIICQGASGVLDILKDATKPNAGGDPNPDNVDLNPLTPEIDRQVVTSAGTFIFDNVNTKLLTFTPKTDFSGSSASIDFNFMDVYGAKSTVGTATFNINSPIITTQPTSATICEKSNFTTTVIATGPSLTYQWEYLNATSGWISLPDPDGSLGAKTNTLSIANVPYTYDKTQYRVRVISPGGCNIVSDIIKLTVNQLPTASISPFQQGVCEGSPDIPVTFTGTNGTGPYTFYYTISDGTVKSAIKTLTTSSPGNSITINHPTNVAGVFTYEIVKVSNSTCSNDMIARSKLTIIPNASIVLVPSSGAAIQNVCVGTPMQSIVYQVKDADEATVSFNKLNPDIKGVYDHVKGQITISGTSSVVGRFPFTVSTIGGCSTASTTGEINILPNTTIALTSAVKSDQQEVCVNHAIAQIEYQVTNGKNATVVGLPTEMVRAYDAVTGKFTISGSPATAGLITYTITATGDCQPVSITGTINVKPNVSLTLLSGTKDQTICINTAIEPIVYTVANETGATVDNLPAGIIWKRENGKITISGMPSVSGALHYKITATGDCALASAEGDLTVKPDVSLTLLSGAKDQTVCINAAITAIVYTVANETGATVDNLPAGIIWKRENGKITISGTPTVSGTLHYKITATGDCQSAIAEGDLTVKPDVSLTLLSGAKDQTVCINVAITPIVYTVANETGATVDNLPVGITWKRENGKITISGTPTVSGALHYKITATGDCALASAEGDLTVKPDVSLTLLSGAKDQTVCINVAITPIVYTVANETAVTVANLPVGVSWIQTGNKITISGTPTISGTLHYKITAIGDCQLAIAEGDLTVKPDVSLVLLSGAKDQTVCINVAITPIVYTVANETAVTVANLPVGVSWIQAGNKITISGTPTVSGALHYKITATGDCALASAEGDLTVKPDVSLTLLSGTKDQTICINVAIEPIVYTVANETAVTVANLPVGVSWIQTGNKITISGTPTISGTLHYKITAIGDCQSAIAEGDLTVKPDVSLVLLSGAKDQTVCINVAITPIVYTVANETAVTVANLPVGVSWIQAGNKITISGTPTVSGALHYKIMATGDCALASAEGDLTVKPDVSLTLLSGTKDQTICINVAIEPIVYTVANETAVTVANLPVGVSWIQTGNKITISGTPTVSGTLHYKIAATGDCQLAIAEGDLTVKPDVSLVLLSGAKDQTVCINVAITPIVYTVANETAVTVANLPVGVSWIQAGNKITISGTPTVSGALHYKITATGDCALASAEGDLTVKPDVSLTLLSGTKDQTICINVAIEPIVYTVANETAVTVVNLPVGVSWIQTGNKITISGTPTVSGTLHYKITATGDCQSAIAEGDLTVKPDVSLVLLSGAKDQTVCINVAITPIVYTVANETGATVVNLPAGIIWKRENGKITISGTPTVSGTLHYKITATGDCALASAEGDLTVKPDVLLTLLSGAKDQTVCINVAIMPIVYTVANETGVTVDNLPAGIIWKRENGKITISGTPTVSGALHYKITATGDCALASAEGDLTVKPDVSLTLLSGAKDQTICINTAIEPIVYTVANETAVTVVNLPTGVSWIQAGNKITISGTPTVSGTLHYKITATGDCALASAEGDLTVKPDVSLTLLSGAKDQIICINTAIEPIVYTVANETGTTVVNLPAGIIWKRENGKITISGVPTVSGTLHYKIMATGDCALASDEGDLTVKPDVSLTLFSGAKNQTICINTAIEPIVYTVANETAVTVVNLPAGVSWIQAGNKITISGTPTVSGALHYKITATGDCALASAEGDLTVKPDVSLTLLSGAKDQIICINTAIEPIVYTVANETAVTVVNLPAGVSWIQAGNKITISGAPTVSGTLHYKITATGDCALASAEGDLTVKPDVSLTLLSGAKDQTICINTAIEPIVYTVANETAVTVVNLPAGVSWIQAGNKITISGAPTVSGALHYKITATGDCALASAEGDLTVKPDVSLTLLSGAKDQTICINTAIEPIVYTAANETAVTVVNLPAGVSWIQAGNKITISGVPTVSGTLHYKITATGDCALASAEGDLTVKPDVSLTLLSGAKDQIICINTAIEPIVYTVANETGTTVVNLPAGIIWKRENGKITISGTPTVSGTLHYKITATGDCALASAEGDLTVKPDVSLTLFSGAKDQTICINTAIEPIVYTVANETGATIVNLPAGIIWKRENGKITISGVPTVSGTLHYKITATGDCALASAEGDLIVKPDVTIALTSTVKTDQQELCVNTAITQIEYQVNHGNNATIIGLPAELTANYNATTGKFTISGSPAMVGLITYTITATGDCKQAVITGTINVKPDVTITLTSAVKTDKQELCVNKPITQIEYQVTNGKAATITGLPAELTSAYDALTGKFTISGTPSTAGLITYIINATGNCKTANITGTIFVKPNVELVLTTGSNNQSTCINIPISSTIYTVNNGTAVATNLPPGLNQNYAAGVLTISGSPTQSGTFLYTVTATGECGTKELHAQIDVYPNAIMELTSPAGSDQPVLCINTPLNPIVYKITNATGATISALPAGLISNYDPATKQFTITGTPSISGTFPYTITTTGGCASVTLAGTIKVNPNTTLQLTSGNSTANQTLCINSNNLQTITYQTTNAIDATVTGLPTGLIWSYNNNQLKINGVPTQSGTFNYTVNTTGLCQTQQLSGTIIVTPNPIGFNDVINNLTCTNNSIQYNLQDNVNNTTNGGNSVPATFTWTVAQNNNVKGLNNGSGNNINATLINLSHTPQQVIYTVTPTSTTGGCPGNTFTVTVNVPVCSSLTITKTANVTLVSTAGDQIQYTITIKNTGTASHTNVQVTDPFLGGVLRGPAYGDNGNSILEANESWVYTGTYRVTQTDIDENGKPNAKSGKIINTASLTTAEMSTPLTAVATVDIVTKGSIVLVKTGVISSDFSTIIYTFKITNNGRVKLYNLNLMDTKIGGQINLGTNELAAGASITVTSTYKVSNEEKRDGRVVNTATVKGYTPSGDPISDISGTQANNDEPTVHIIVDAPQAIDDKAEVQINQTVVINIAGNDIASLSGLNKASIENTQPSNGRVDVHMDGTVTYTPNKGYSGQDEFTYYIYDFKVGTPNRSNKATVTITVIPIDLFIPNTITPNGDGKNDTFKIIGRESFDGIELMVFNRWGNEVYRNNNYLDEWDGSGLTEGTYYYVLTLKKAGSKVNKNGWILIKR